MENVLSLKYYLRSLDVEAVFGTEEGNLSLISVKDFLKVIGAASFAIREYFGNITLGICPLKKKKEDKSEIAFDWLKRVQFNQLDTQCNFLFDFES